MELVDTEMADLTSHGTYVAGFTDASIEARTELYDLFINGNLIFLVCLNCNCVSVPANAVTVAPHAKGMYVQCCGDLFSLKEF